MFSWLAAQIKAWMLTDFFVWKQLSVSVHRSPSSWTCWSVSAQIWPRISLWMRGEQAAVPQTVSRGRQWGQAGRSCGGSWEELHSHWVSIRCCLNLQVVGLSLNISCLSFSQCTSPAVAMTTWLCPGSSMSTVWPLIGRLETLCLTFRWHVSLFFINFIHN